MTAPLLEVNDLKKTSARLLVEQGAGGEKN
jgi:hypothetical protein